MPCFWLYGEVEQHVIANQIADNPYQKFIDTYAGEAYDRVTVLFVQLVENYGQQSSVHLKNEMKEAFLQSALFEYLVFEEVEKTDYHF